MTDTNEVKNNLAKLFAACWEDDALECDSFEHGMGLLAKLSAACRKDDALKQRFLSDTHTVLAEHGMDVPEGMNVNDVIIWFEKLDVARMQFLSDMEEGYS